MRMRPSTPAVNPILALILALGAALPAVHGQTDWPTYGRDAGGQRYSPLTQINGGNVTNLVRAWTYHMKPAAAPSKPPENSAQARGRRRGPESQAVPLVVNG